MSTPIHANAQRELGEVLEIAARKNIVTLHSLLCKLRGEIDRNARPFKTALQRFQQGRRYPCPPCLLTNALRGAVQAHSGMDGGAL